MTIALKSFSAAGVDITDELVRCDTPVVINTVTYNTGCLNYVAGQSVYGNTDASYGVWTAAAKGGSRRFVNIESLPGENTSVMIDCATGVVYSLTNEVLYVCYRAHAPAYWHDLGLKSEALEIDVPYLLTAGASITLATVKPTKPMALAYASVAINGANPSSASTITLSNGVETQALTIPTTGTVYNLEFPAILKVTPQQTLTISTTNGYGAHGLSIHLAGM